jgi:hypothetical protein
MYFKIAVRIWQEYTFRWTDCKLCKFEDIVERFNVGIEYSEGVL